MKTANLFLNFLTRPYFRSNFILYHLPVVFFVLLSFQLQGQTIALEKVTIPYCEGMTSVALPKLLLKEVISTDFTTGQSEFLLSLSYTGTGTGTVILNGTNAAIALNSTSNTFTSTITPGSTTNTFVFTINVANNTVLEELSITGLALSIVGVSDNEQITLNITNNGTATPSFTSNLSVSANFKDHSLSPGTTKANTLAGPFTYCAGDALPELTVDGNTYVSSSTSLPNLNYTWERNIGSGWVVIGATSAAYTPPSLTQITSFRRITSTSLSQCAVTSTPIEIKVTALTPGSISFDAGAALSALLICDNTPVTIFNTGDATSTTGEIITYAWYSNTPGSETIILGTGAALTLNTPQTTYADGTQFYRKASSPLCNTIVESNRVTLNMASGITPGAIAINGTAATLFRACSGSTIGLAHTFTNTNNYALNYAWQILQTDGTWQTVNSNQNLNIVSLFVGQRTYRNLITISGTNCTYNSNSVTLIGHQLNSAGTISLSATQVLTSRDVCSTELPTISAGNAPLVNPANSDVGVNYEWESRNYNTTTATGGVWSNIPAATNSDYTLDNPLPETRQYRRKAFLTISGVPCNVGNSPAISNIVTLNYIAPLLGGTTRLQTDTATPAASSLFLCETFAPITLAVTNDSGSSGLLLEHQWQKSINEGISWQNVPVNGTAATLNVSSILENTDFRRRTTLAGNTTCFVYSSIFNVRVNSLNPGNISFNNSSPSNTLTLCAGASYPTIFSTVDGFTQYPGQGAIQWVWQQSINNGTTWTDIAPFSTNPNFPTLSGTISSSMQLRRMAQYTDGTATAACAPPKAAVTGNTENVLRILVLPAINGGSIDAAVTAQFICSSGSVPAQLTVTDTNSATALYYQWERLDNSGGWTQLLGENGSFLTFTTTTTPTATTRYRRGTYNADPQLGNVCAAYTTNEAVVNVYSITKGTILLQDTVLCAGASTIISNTQVPITNPAQTISYAWQFTTDDIIAIAPGSINWTTVAINNPAYNTGALSQRTSFRRVERFENCSDTYSNIVTVAVLPNLEAGTTVRTLNEVCSGTSGGTLSVTLTNPLPANVFHQWYSRTDPNATFNLIIGAQGLTFDVPNLFQTTYFTRKTYYAVSTACAIFSPTVVVNVNTLNAGTITGSATVCEGQQNISLGSTSAPAALASFSVQWQQTINPANPNTWQNINSATNNTYTIPLAPSQQTHYRRKITNTISGCEAFSNSVIIDVITYDGNPNIQFFGFQNSSLITFCGNALPLLVGSAIIPRTNETLGYKWYESADNNVWTAIAGATQINYQPTAKPNIIYYKREVNISKNGVNCLLESNVLGILPANPGFIINTGSIFTTDSSGTSTGNNSQVICSGDSPNILVGDVSTVTFEGANQPFSYQWYSSTDDLNFQPVTINGNQKDLSVGVNLTTTTYFFRATFPTSSTVSCTSISSNRITITVPTSGNLGIQGQLQRVICPGTPIQTLTSSRLIGATELSTLSFQWWQKIGNGSFTTISGATNQTYSPATLTTTTSFKRIATYFIDTDGNGTADCPETPIESNELTFTVNTANPGKIAYAGNLINSNTAQVCYGTAPEKLITNSADPYAIVGATALFQWQTSPDNINWSNTSVTTQDYSSPALTTTTYVRRLVGSVHSPSNITCWSNPADSNVLILQVFPELQKPILSSTVNLACDTASSVGTITITNFSSAPSVAYTWFSSTDGAIWNVVTNGGSNFTGDVLSLNTLDQTTYYKVEATQTTTPAACKQTSAILEIRVVALDAGTISFQDNSVPDFYYPTCTTSNNNIFISSFNGATPTAPNFESTLEVFWQGRSNMLNATWTDLNAIPNNTLVGNALQVFGTLSSSIYIRRGVRVPTSNGGFCTSYSNSVFIDVIAPNTLNSINPSLFTTAVSCPGGSDGKIELLAADFLPPSATITQKQRVDLSLSGFFKSGNEFTVNINGIAHVYTATNSDTSLALLLQNIGNALIALNLPNLTITNNTDATIGIESTNANSSFSISTSVNSTRNIRFDLEYKRGSRPENTYSWARFVNGLIDPSFSNPGTLSLTAISAGNYQLTVSNGPTCNTVKSPFFVVEEPQALAGQITNANSAVVCENEAIELVVSNASTYTNQLYRWEFSLDNAAWLTLQIGGLDVTSANVSLPNITANTYFRRVLRFTDATGAICGGNFLTASYLVTLNTAVPGVIKALEPIVCIGSIPLAITTDSSVPYNPVLYSGFIWQRTEDLTGINPLWLVIAGATAENLTFTAPLLKSTKYRRIAIRTISGKSCESIASNEITITIREKPSIANATIATTGLTPVSCFGAMDGAITLNPSTDIVFPVYPGSPNTNTALYLWRNLDNPSFSANTASLTGLGGGRYQLQLTYDFCTVLSDIFTIAEPDVFEIDAVAQCDNTLTLAIAGGSENYEITLTAPNGQQTINFSNGNISFRNLISGGTYTVSVDDIGARSCPPLTETLTVPTNLIIDEATINVNNATCFGVNDGRIILNNGGITVSGGVAPYNYTWTAPSGASFISQNISGLAPGTYMLSVSDQSGCSATTTISVASIANLQITNTQVTNEFLTCKGATNASIAIQIASDANSTLQISWFKNGTSFASNVSAIENLGAGSYRVEVRTNANCMVEDTFEIIEPEVLTASLLKLSLASCADGAGSSVSFNIQGGTAPYSYSLNNGAQQALAANFTIANLPTGSYSITLTDSNECNEISIPVSVPELEPLEVTMASEGAITPVQCALGGSITVEVTGGTAPYFYIWSGPGYSKTGANLNVISDLTNAGAYTLTVTDANQCSSAAITMQLLDESARFGLEVFVENQSCNAAVNNNSIRLNATGTVTNPFNVQWEIWIKKADPSCAQDCFEWKPLPNSNGSLTLNGLAIGRYRVTFSDSSTAGCNSLTKIIEIPAPLISINQTLLKEPTCDTPTGEFGFTMEQRNLISLFLNGNLLAIGNGTLNYDSRTKKYSLVGLSSGEYTLRAVERIQNGGVEIAGCEAATSFIISEYRPLAYQGETDFEIDICESTPEFTLNTADISGGTPFLDNQGNPFYNYTWFGPNNFGITGVATIPVEVGAYRLEISDAEGCLADAITFNFKNQFEAIQVTSTISRPSCEGNQKNGAINIIVNGGKLPYAIVWEKEIINIINGGVSYELIATNTLRLNNLDEGRYRLKVVSNFVGCGNLNHPASSFTTIFSLEGSNTLSLKETPIFSDELCKGNAGTIILKLFDATGSADEPSFYYNGGLVTGRRTAPETYQVFIEAPLDTALLTVINALGCELSVPILLGVPDAQFSETSTSFEAVGLFSTGEPISFTNLTEGTFAYAIWDFGDGTTLELGPENDSDTVTHTYDFDGVFKVKLSIFNNAGCFTEMSKELAIGKGYELLFPNAFSPNQDGINDYFEGAFNGFTKFSLEVYSPWGSLLYAANHETINTPKNWGWNGNYSNGDPYTGKYFRFVFTGTLVDESTIVKAGEAVILK